jgi:hypothetical protein
MVKSVQRLIHHESSRARARARRLVKESGRIVGRAKALRSAAFEHRAESAYLSGRPYPSRWAGAPAARPRWPLRFAVAGIVMAWNPFSRDVQISERTFTVAPTVSITEMAPGAHILAAGHQEHAGASQVITRFTIR